MAEINPPFVDSTDNNTAEEFRLMLQTVTQGLTGVIGAADFQVTQHGTPNMSVDVAKGKALIGGTEGATQGTYHVVSNGTKNLTVPASDVTHPTNSLIIARVQDSQYSGVTDAWSLQCITGTPGGGDPALPANSLTLARVIVPAGATSVLTANIQDLRQSATLSGANTGDIKMTGATAVPGGWLLCDGSAVNRVTYASLFGAIGIAYGAGDGSTTFNVPDLRGRTPIGTGTGTGLTARAIGAIGGEENHTLSTGEMPAHSHSASVSDAGSGTPHGWGAFEPNSLGPGAHYPGLYGDATHTNFFYTLATLGIPSVSIGNAGGGAAHNNMQPFAVVKFIIKT